MARGCCMYIFLVNIYNTGQGTPTAERQLLQPEKHYLRTTKNTLPKILR